MQVYRGLPILTNQSSYPTRLVGDLAARPRGIGRGVRAPGPRCDRRDPRRRPHAGRRRRDRPLPPGRARRPRAAARARAGRARALAGALRRATRRPRTRGSASSTRRRPPLSTQNDRRRVVRALELAEAGILARARPPTASGRRRRGIRPSSSGSTCRRSVLERRIEERTRAMFDAGVEEEVRRALAGPISATARKTLGLDEVAELAARGGDRRDHRAHAPLRRLPAQVDAPRAGPRYGRRRSPAGRDRR